MPQVPTLLEMLKAGVHFGHQTAKWHPKMRPFIYTSRQGIHILDLEKTARELDRALTFLRDIAAAGGTVLFTSLKDQANEITREVATKSGMPYIIERWLGGVFTNFGVISKLLRRLDQLESEQARGVWDQKYSKKEQLTLTRDLEKLVLTVGGIRNLTKLPQAMFLVGAREGKHAIREARKVGVPIVAIVDTNTNPDGIDYPIPANDDALRSIQLIMNLTVDAIMEGKQQIEVATPVAPSAVAAA